MMSNMSNIYVFIFLRKQKILNVYIYIYIYVYFQTFLNDAKIPDDDYVTVEHLDTVRFGSDILFLLIAAWVN